MKYARNLNPRGWESLYQKRIIRYLIGRTDRYWYERPQTACRRGVNLLPLAVPSTLRFKPMVGFNTAGAAQWRNIQQSQLQQKSCMQFLPCGAGEMLVEGGIAFSLTCI